MLKEKLGKIYFVIVCLLACFPVLPMKLTVLLIMAFTAMSIVNVIVWKQPFATPLRVRELVMLLLPFLLILLRTGITDRSPDALFYLEVSLSLLVFPLAFFLSPAPLTTKQKNILNYCFAGATILILLSGELRTIMKLAERIGPDGTWPGYSSLLHDVSFGYFFRTYFEEFTGIHPTYASLFAGISILILLNAVLQSYRTFTRAQLLVVVSALLLLVILQVLLASRTPFLATMLTAFVLLLIRVKQKILVLYALGGIAVLSSILIWSVPSFSTRFNEISFRSAAMPDATTENSFNIRFGIYKCSTDIIRDNWLWGIGPGNVQPTLNACYNTISKEVYDQKNYNTHNQFFDYWAGLGILGPLSLLLILVYTSVKNYRNGNPLAFCISVLFLVAMLTENLLNRQNGIVTFAFFTSLYFFSEKKAPGAV